MDNPVYIALSSQLAAMRDLDSTANNMANANTSGYQASRIMFSAYLANGGKTGKIAFANDIANYRETTPGDLQQTGNPLDVAIGGQGYFTVETPQGQRYTRSGVFQLDATGTLITPQGYPVLDNNGQHIVFNQEDTDIQIGGAGNITINGEPRQVLGVVDFANPQALIRQGNSLFTTTQTPQPAASPRVAQGMVEKSNIQPVVEITHLIDIQRAVNNSAKYIQTMYDLQNRAGTVWTQQVS